MRMGTGIIIPMTCVLKVGHSCKLETRVPCRWMEEKEVGASQQGIEHRLPHAISFHLRTRGAFMPLTASSTN